MWNLNWWTHRDISVQLPSAPHTILATFSWLFWFPACNFPLSPLSSTITAALRLSGKHVSIACCLVWTRRVQSAELQISTRQWCMDLSYICGQCRQSVAWVGRVIKIHILINGGWVVAEIIHHSWGKQKQYVGLPIKNLTSLIIQFSWHDRQGSVRI